ncbi:protein NIM1-INTERACTING 1-like [Neltuma alba]|uniref:protein NIM1-INTERACTING 1-like n=1 Tax=Neltuma alba TaxID=207710 RepID=UPI0010A5430A|nr:protein NIM1-INTERACTING 1-like [Prosopis alba]XP_028786204.1 protein NIM1-INTERACTING 1-like [Prosopis alba]
MEGTSDSKKRKICCGEDDEEEDDEIKMEKFFALVRSIRESRERLIKFGSDAYGETENGSGKAQNRVGVWKPQFQIEDFMEVDPHQDRSQKHAPLNSSLPDHASPDKKKVADEEREAEKGMNLSLSL